MNVRRAARSQQDLAAHASSHQALMRAAIDYALPGEAERIIEGVQALTLRAVVRGVGVSHMAPQNHFGDLTGLLSELAAAGYIRLAFVLTDAMDTAGPDMKDRAKAMGVVYFRFANRYRGLFTLMFRSERLDTRRPALRQAMTSAHDARRGNVMQRSSAVSKSDVEIAAQTVALWALVHGYCGLLLDGRLTGTLA